MSGRTVERQTMQDSPRESTVDTAESRGFVGVRTSTIVENQDVEMHSPSCDFVSVEMTHTAAWASHEPALEAKQLPVDDEVVADIDEEGQKWIDKGLKGDLEDTALSFDRDSRVYFDYLDNNGIN